MAQKANAVYLICGYQMLYTNRTLDEVTLAFERRRRRRLVDEKMMMR